MKRIYLFVTCIILLNSFTGCSLFNKVGEIKGDIENYSVTEYNNTFEKQPDTIIALSPQVCQILVDLGVEGKLIGKGEQCTYPEQISSVQNVGGCANPDIDKIIELKPDAVITQSPIADLHIDTLQKNGIKVIALEQSSGFEEVVNTYKSLGNIVLGNNSSKEVVDKIITPMNELVKNIRDKKYSLNYLCIASQDGAIATKDTFADNILTLFGNNAAGDSTGMTMSAESIKASKVDVVFINDQIKKDNLSEQLKAVINKEGVTVVEYKSSYFEQPSASIKDLISELDNKVGSIANAQ